MAPTLFLIFNHSLTESQKHDARLSLGINRIVDLPADLKMLWSHVPPKIIELKNYIEPIKNWLSSQAQKEDYVLVQGDFGATYLMVSFAFEQRLIPLYATTQRETVEEPRNDGTVKVTRQFKHEIFRKYERS